MKLTEEEYEEEEEEIMRRDVGDGDRRLGLWGKDIRVNKAA